MQSFLNKLIYGLMAVLFPGENDITELDKLESCVVTE